MLLPIAFGLIALLLVGVMISKARWARVFGIALAFPVALLSYGSLGVWIARLIGVGHFYSVPLGAAHIEDWQVLASLVFSTGIWALLILWLLGRRRGAP